MGKNSESNTWDDDEELAPPATSKLKTKEEHLLEYEKRLIDSSKELHKSIDKKIITAYGLAFTMILLSSGLLAEGTIGGTRIRLESFGLVLLFTGMVMFSIYCLASYQLRELFTVYESLDYNSLLLLAEDEHYIPTNSYTIRSISSGVLSFSLYLLIQLSELYRNLTGLPKFLDGEPSSKFPIYIRFIVSSFKLLIGGTTIIIITSIILLLPILTIVIMMSAANDSGIIMVPLNEFSIYSVIAVLMIFLIVSIIMYLMDAIRSYLSQYKQAELLFQWRHRPRSLDSSERQSAQAILEYFSYLIADHPDAQVHTQERRGIGRRRNPPQRRRR